MDVVCPLSETGRDHQSGRTEISSGLVSSWPTVHDGPSVWMGVRLPSPGSGSQSWLFCPLISLASAAAERERDLPLYSTRSRSPFPDMQRDFWNSQAARNIQLYSDHFQSLNLDSEVARVLHSGWSGGQHLPANVQDMCSLPHIMSVLYSWLSAQCSNFDVVGPLQSALSPQMHQSPPHQFPHLPRYPARS